ncbi:MULTISPECIES: hypothetical protein [Actinoplanes]|uniref:hypothetical protein n=1 Tax=Actinoplanes TaxID=1865 RepID=UPI0005F2AB0C|nr:MULTISPECIES: hypothetical protein [Actinoplanes]GLX99708.1 hypothetical protein Acsp01_00880 [Actinoplanes sp. NBRC 101535]
MSIGWRSTRLPPHSTTAAVAFARQAVRAGYPEEYELFDEVVEEYAHWSGQTPLRRLRTPIGVGVDVAAVTPVILSALNFLGAAVTTHVVDEALAPLSEGARRRLVTVFRRGDTGESRPRPRPAAAIKQRTAPESDDWHEITIHLVPLLKQHGLNAGGAGEAAQHIVTVLRRYD